jgi:hypothetical protein
MQSGLARHQRAEPFGHVSTFSPTRVHRLAAVANLELEWMTGTFLVRSSGSPIENSGLWVRLNVLFGALFPGWPGECYWQFRRVAAAPPGNARQPAPWRHWPQPL